MKNGSGCLQVYNVSDIERYVDLVRDAAANVQRYITGHDLDALELLFLLKFEARGFHPISGHALNVMEQINQTWTFLAALSATRHLLEMHPEAEGFLLAPGANASIELDIMSCNPGLVGAEIFAAVDPKNNKKLETDLQKLTNRKEQFRYVFFLSPRFPGFTRLQQFERNGIEVWSLDAF